MAEEPEAGAQSPEQLLGEIERRLAQMGWIASGVGTVVLFITVGFLIPVFLDPDERTELALLNAPLTLAAVAIGVPLTTRYIRRRRERVLRWLREGRAPDEEEHRLSLTLAAQAAWVTAAAWWISALLLAVFNGFAHSLGFAAVVGATIVVGGETTAALTYLFAERILRPVTARVLAARLPRDAVAPGVRGRLAIAWGLGTGAPLAGVLVIGIVGATKSDVATEYVSAAVIFLSVISLAVGLLATLIAGRSIADPVIAVRAGLDRIEAGDLGVSVEVDDGSEVGLLQAGFNRMTEGLRERERIRDLFGRQVGHDVARVALQERTKLGGEEREIGALFVDLTGSTSMALAMPPTAVVRLLNRFFRVVVDVVEAEGGLVNKFEGDAALCVFGAPIASEDPAGSALAAARKLDRRLREEVPELDFGIGVSAGVAVAGNVGAEQRFEYTVIGDPVNEAARLSELAKQRPTGVLASRAALARATRAEAASWSCEEEVSLRGRDKPTGLAEPVRR